MRAISMPRPSRTVIDETTSPRLSFSFTLLRRMSLGRTALPPVFCRWCCVVGRHHEGRPWSAQGNVGGAAYADIARLSFPVYFGGRTIDSRKGGQIGQESLSPDGVR